MLPRVAVGRHCCAQATDIENYRSIVGDELIDAIRQLSQQLRDVRVCHVNATAVGVGFQPAVES